MADWTLADIKLKVRQTTGRLDSDPSTTDLSDTTLVDYINKYYQYVLLKELKIIWGYTYYTFFTSPGVDAYVGPQNSFQTVNPRVWVGGFPVDWYLSPDTFYQDYPQQQTMEGVGTGDGVTVVFPFATQQDPIVTGSVYVSAGSQVAQDNGAGGFYSPSSGTINYSAGTGSVTFSSAPSVSQAVTINYETFYSNRPQAILYYRLNSFANSTSSERDNKKYFVLRPIPDRVYEVKMQGIQIPQPLSSDADVPFRQDLGPLIAYGASLEIFSDFNQMGQYQETLVQYNRYKDICMQDSYEEYLYERSVPTF